MKNKQISILGCGWLGLPLAKYFTAKGFKVKGSTTSKEKINLLKSNNITPYVFTLGEENNDSKYLDFLNKSAVVFINIPPKLEDDVETIYKNQIKVLFPFISDNQHVVFISSTSVYQNTNNWVTEDLELYPEKSSGKAILALEDLLQKELKQRLTIIRFSGLVGPERLPGKFLAGKKELSNRNGLVNVIHQTDCIRLIFEVVNKNCWGEIINGCADKHPTREDYYTKAATKIGLEPPTFLKDSNLSFKKVCNKKGKTLLDFKYQFSDPMGILE